MRKGEGGRERETERQRERDLLGRAESLQLEARELDPVVGRVGDQIAFFRSLPRTGARRNAATSGTDQGYLKRRFDHVPAP